MDTMMKTLYLDCSMGAAGDMLTAALLELVPNPDSVITRLNGLGIPGVQARRETAVKCGITGTHLTVTVGGTEEESEDVHHAHHHEEHHHEEHHHEEHTHEGHTHEGHTHEEHTHEEHTHEEHTHEEHTHEEHHHEGHTHEGHTHEEHHHGSMAEIEQIVAGLQLSEQVRRDILAVYQLIAEAESKVHGLPVSQVHFHEVGSMDALADIAGVALLLEELAPHRIVASPVHVGSGQVRCAHGVLPVPAPATVELLRGIPIYGGSIEGELCTPTGAALLRHFVDHFGEMPPMSVEKIGYGMGKKDFPAANCLRALLGAGCSAAGPNDHAVELCCNLDDMTGEALAFACEALLGAGALDVFTQPIQMKKGRPAQLLTCLASPEDADRLAALLLRQTTTFGVRRRPCQRYILDRVMDSLETPYGDVRIKTGSGYGVEKSKPEYEDLAAAARAHGVSIGEVLQTLWGKP